MRRGAGQGRPCAAGFLTARGGDAAQGWEVLSASSCVTGQRSSQGVATGCTWHIDMRVTDNTLLPLCCATASLCPTWPPTVNNKDLEQFIPMLIDTMQNPIKVPDCVHKLAATTFVQVRTAV